MIILKDIAQMAGVNISTVSRALNDSNEVSDEKKQEIRNIAASLNYTPNYYCRKRNKNCRCYCSGDKQ